MLFRHRVIDGNKILVFCDLLANSMLLIRGFGLERWKSYAAAAHYCLSCRYDDISADRADIELASRHFERAICVSDILT